MVDVSWKEIPRKLTILHAIEFIKNKYSQVTLVLKERFIEKNS